MKKISLTFLFFLFVLSLLKAQEVKPHFNSINSIGLAGGQSDPQLIFQSVNGLKFSNWYLGIGVGIDNYKYKTLPLFLDVRRYLGKKKSGFVYGDVGYNFPLKNTPGPEISYYTSYKFVGGSYADMGIGYQFLLTKKSSIAFTLGYSYKDLKTEVETAYICLVGPCPVDYSTYKFSYNRVMMKVGWVFEP